MQHIHKNTHTHTNTHIIHFMNSEFCSHHDSRIWSESQECKVQYKNTGIIL